MGRWRRDAAESRRVMEERCGDVVLCCYGLLWVASAKRVTHQWNDEVGRSAVGSGFREGEVRQKQKSRTK